MLRFSLHYCMVEPAPYVRHRTWTGFVLSLILSDPTPSTFSIKVATMVLYVRASNIFGLQLRKWPFVTHQWKIALIRFLKVLNYFFDQTHHFHFGQLIYNNIYAKSFASSLIGNCHEKKKQVCWKFKLVFRSIQMYILNAASTSEFFLNKKPAFFSNVPCRIPNKFCTKKWFASFDKGAKEDWMLWWLLILRSVCTHRMKYTNAVPIWVLLVSIG